jgi:hypothetical protein
MLAIHGNERHVSACLAHIAFGAEESSQMYAEQNKRRMARSEQVGFRVPRDSRQSRDKSHATLSLMHVTKHICCHFASRSNASLGLPLMSAVNPPMVHIDKRYRHWKLEGPVLKIPRLFSNTLRLDARVDGFLITVRQAAFRFACCLTPISLHDGSSIE